MSRLRGKDLKPQDPRLSFRTVSEEPWDLGSLT